ncbi:hypothetical protein [Microbacterium pygmaeum]|uniref:hypothetical protein n=1 Tax=Microbacterium pygmaeum TaxID=370764 RepID=UPI0012F8AA6B|nr:hypothetical protein [Microbacterium pygmaeum]
MPFIRDWVLIATVPVWLPLGITALVRGSVADAKVELPIAAALFAYALALAAAFLDDLSHTSSPIKAFTVLRPISVLIKWATVVIASAAIGVLALQELLRGSGELTLATADTVFVSAALAAACFLLSFFVVLFGDGARTRGIPRRSRSETDS